MRYLVTGATGFLGTALCGRLLADGIRVRALVRPSSDTGLLERSGVELIEGDLTDTWSLTGALQGIDVVIHAGAAHRGGRLSRTDFWQVNAEGTRRLLQEAVTSGVRRFVYISTAGVHGDVGKGLATEQARLAPRDLYGLTKLRGEQAVRLVARTDGIETVILRPCHIYGAGDRRLLKLFHPISRRRFALIGSASTQIHFIALEDATAAIIAASRSDAAGGHTFLLAGPRPTSMKEMVQTVAAAVGAPAPALRVPYAPVWLLASATETVCRMVRVEPPLYRRQLAFFGVNRAYCTDKIRAVLETAPRIEWDQGARRLADWYREEGLL